jgi:spermidine synthase
VKDALDENGIFSFSLTASENYISPELAKCLQSVYSGLRQVFRDILVIPGESACFMASDKPGTINGDYASLMKQVYARGMDLKYVREYYLFPRFSPGLMGYIDGVLRKVGSVKPNHDFYPSAYYYNMIFWASRMKDGFLEKMLKAVDHKNMAAVILGVCALIILYGLIRLARKKFSYKISGLLAFAIMSFSMMAFQIIVLFSFQAIYGYIFYKIGLLIALFMAGLALGSFCASHSSFRLKGPLDQMVLICFLFCVFISTMPVVFCWLASVIRGPTPWLGANLVFPLLSLVPGLFAGAQFVFTNKLCLGQEGEIGKVAGLTYGLDLLGSCCGALLTGIFLVPGLGIFGSCYAVAAINLSVLSMLLLSRPRGLTS